MGAGEIGPRSLRFVDAVLVLGALVALTSTASPARADWDAEQDRFWSRLRDLPLWALRLDVGGRLRIRQEHDDAFTVKGYLPEGGDDVLLERVRLDLDLRMGKDAHVLLQVQDAHAFFTRYAARDFPRTNPYEDIADLRQAFFEWRGIGGGPLGIKLGRQEISYGDERVFGPGSWGNTGRYSWDAAMLEVESQWLWAHLWVGRYLRNLPDVWPNSPSTQPTFYVAYVGLRRLPFRFDLFYAIRHDWSGQVAGELGKGDIPQREIERHGASSKVHATNGWTAA